MPRDFFFPACSGSLSPTQPSAGPAWAVVCVVSPVTPGYAVGLGTAWQPDFIFWQPWQWQLLPGASAAAPLPEHFSLSDLQQLLEGGTCAGRVIAWAAGMGLQAGGEWCPRAKQAGGAGKTLGS